MKCAACGYYVDMKQVSYTPISYYKSGKKKGKVRKVGKPQHEKNLEGKKEFK